MTKNDDDDQKCREDTARQRVNEISDLFANMRAIVVRWIEDADPVAEATSKQMMTKIGELQSTHLSVIRAEEAFHDKFGNGEVEDGIDFEAARHDIGCELDRLRSTIEAGCISEGSDDISD